MRFLTLMLMVLAQWTVAQNPYLLVGTYTAKGSEGIYVFRFNQKTGELTPVSVGVDVKNPSFLALAPSGNHLYSVDEVDNGGVTAWGFDAETGTLTKMNSQSAGGKWPCHMETDATGKWLIAGNYGSGNLRVFPVLPDGSLGEPVQTIQHEGSGPNTSRQESPHVHSVNFSPDQKQVLVPDLGIDKVMAYDFDAATGRLTPSAQPFQATPPGSGPRHLAYHPNGKFVYTILELTSQVAVYGYENGTLTERQVISTLPADFTEKNTCADIHLSPDGKFLYGSNRGHNSLAIYSVNSQTGELTFVSHQPVGKTPRNFSLDPGGKFLLVANQDSDNILIFRRNVRKGTLTPTPFEAKVSMPVCLKFRTVK